LPCLEIWTTRAQALLRKDEHSVLAHAPAFCVSRGKTMSEHGRNASQAHIHLDIRPFPLTMFRSLLFTLPFLLNPLLPSLTSYVRYRFSEGFWTHKSKSPSSSEASQIAFQKPCWRPRHCGEVPGPLLQSGREDGRDCKVRCITRRVSDVLSNWMRC